LGKSRKLAETLLVASKPNTAGGQNIASSFAFGLGYSSRAFLHGKVHNGPNTSYMLGRANDSLHWSTGVRKFSILSSCSQNAFQSQLAWKRLVALGSRAPKASPIFSKVACAIGLAVSRSNIAPYLVAFIAGEVMLA
jgi:aarF domain-containing kinase